MSVKSLVRPKSGLAPAERAAGARRMLGEHDGTLCKGPVASKPIFGFYASQRFLKNDYYRGDVASSGRKRSHGFSLAIRWKMPGILRGSTLRGQATAVRSVCRPLRVRSPERDV